ncbi:MULTISPECIES: hypothetical protein [unclassified Neorhizobium]|uniref:hypothetical protein n=1 Tax=unclassified Neorhizobium TaxID=2629175 RepID=UPI001FF5CFA9|nr:MULTISPECIES: hypothetical protein [unclassified Neorhizobium]MCJ9670331.1 hypothetical protein [Neorhizobium sp. SHOUNA12B]MCJ9746586.1 hypothetical protein [Neorhizobium sp. SHOUNA12A]
MNVYVGEILKYGDQGEVVENQYAVEADNVQMARSIIEEHLLNNYPESQKNTWLRITREGVEVEARQLQILPGTEPPCTES